MNTDESAGKIKKKKASLPNALLQWFLSFLSVFICVPAAAGGFHPSFQ
jgi:hypothetical protein